MSITISLSRTARFTTISVKDDIAIKYNKNIKRDDYRQHLMRARAFWSTSDEQYDDEVVKARFIWRPYMLFWQK